MQVLQFRGIREVEDLVVLWWYLTLPHAALSFAAAISAILSATYTSFPMLRCRASPSTRLIYLETA